MMRDAATMIEVSVSDTGIGVPEEYREKIFEAYRQVDGSDTRSYPGTGLGLAIARQIIELHNGTIRRDCPGRAAARVHLHPPASKESGARRRRRAIIIEGMDDSRTADGITGYSPIPAGIPERRLSTTTRYFSSSMTTR